MKRVTSDPQVLGGMAVIEGTRLSVEWLYQLLAAGYPLAALQEELGLDADDVQAVFQYAYWLVSRFHKVIEQS